MPLRAAATLLLLISLTSVAAFASNMRGPVDPRFMAIAKSVGEAFNLTTQMQNEQRQHHHLNLTNLATLVRLGEPGDGSRLAHLVDSHDNDCRKVIHLPEEQPPLRMGDNFSLPMFSIEISGANCPVHYLVTLDGHQTPTGIDAQMSFLFEAMNDEGRQTNDVDVVHYSAIMHGTVAQSLAQTATINFTATFNGNGHSQTQGAFTSDDGMNVDFAITTNPNDPNGGILALTAHIAEDFRFIFRDYNVLMSSRQSMDANGQAASYKINNQDVSEADYKAYHDSLQIPGMNTGGNQGPPPGANLYCEVDRFDAAQAPITVVTQWANGLQPPTVAPLSTQMSCGASRANTDADSANNVFVTTFDYSNPHYATVSVAAPGSAPMISNVFLTDEDRAYAGAWQGFTFLSRCRPVPSCQ